jgi:hypothetical protein
MPYFADLNALNNDLEGLWRPRYEYLKDHGWLLAAKNGSPLVILHWRAGTKNGKYFQY